MPRRKSVSNSNIIKFPLKKSIFVGGSNCHVDYCSLEASDVTTIKNAYIDNFWMLHKTKVVFVKQR